MDIEFKTRNQTTYYPIQEVDIVARGLFEFFRYICYVIGPLTARP